MLNLAICDNEPAIIEELEEYLGFSVRRLIFVVMFYSATMEISASEFL